MDTLLEIGIDGTRAMPGLLMKEGAKSGLSFVMPDELSEPVAQFFRNYVKWVRLSADASGKTQIEVVRHLDWYGLRPHSEMVGEELTEHLQSDHGWDAKKVKARTDASAVNWHRSAHSEDE